MSRHHITLHEKDSGKHAGTRYNLTKAEVEKARKDHPDFNIKVHDIPEEPKTEGNFALQHGGDE